MSTKEINSEEIILEPSALSNGTINIKALTDYIIIDLSYLDDDYKILQRVLKKLKFNTIENYIEILFFPSFKISPEKIINKIQDDYLPQSSEEIKTLAQEIYANQFVTIENDFKKKFDHLNLLSPQENNVFIRMNNLILKSFIKYSLMGPTAGEPLRAFIKPFIIEYIESYNSYYEEKDKPDEIIEYIKKFKSLEYEDILKKYNKKRKSITEEYRYARNIWENLPKLHDKLVNTGRIKSNSDFFRFSSIVSEPDLNKTIWLKAQPELIYLIYLIFDGVTVYQTESIYEVICKLFKSKDREYEKNILATTFSNIKESISSNKLSKNLKHIKIIFDELQLNK